MRYQVCVEPRLCVSTQAGFLFPLTAVQGWERSARLAEPFEMRMQRITRVSDLECWSLLQLSGAELALREAAHDVEYAGRQSPQV
jgi:hypothetical protein